MLQKYNPLKNTEKQKDTEKKTAMPNKIKLNIYY